MTEVSEDLEQNFKEDERIMKKQEKEKDELIVHLLKKITQQEQSTSVKSSRKKNDKSEFFQTASSFNPSLSKKFNSSLESLDIWANAWFLSFLQSFHK